MGIICHIFQYYNNVINDDDQTIHKDIYIFFYNLLFKVDTCIHEFMQNTFQPRKKIEY